jgi:hypothetical protein
MTWKLASLLALLFFALLALGGVASAQAPDGASPERVQQQRAPAACPPELEWGCVLSGSTTPGLSLNSTSTTNNSYSLYASLNNPGSGSAAVWGRVLGSGSRGYGVYGSHQGSGYGVYGFSNNGIGFLGYSNTSTGMQGETNSTGAQPGILGLHRATTGIGAGIEGRTNSTETSPGVLGIHTATSGTGAGVEGRTNSTGEGPGVLGIHSATSGTGAGVEGRTSSTSENVQGVLGVVSATSSTATSAGVRGINNGTGYGVHGTGDSIGVLGEGNFFGVWGVGPTYGVHGEGHTGVHGDGEIGVHGDGITHGVYGESRAGNGVKGSSENGNGVVGASQNGYGVSGYSRMSVAISGESYDYIGVHGHSTRDRGVWGTGATYGVEGEGNSIGVYGISDYNGGVAGVGPEYGTYGEGFNGIYGKPNGVAGSRAGYFAGNVHIAGGLTRSSDAFKIDHPLDPENQYLSHSSVESPDMKTVYDGNVTLDANGGAVVELPTYVQALNRDFRYQLTAIGAPGPNLYIASEIQNNRFTIAGGTAGMKVSWEVTGIRQDPWANENRTPVEEPKPADERGTYLYPEGYGQPESRGVNYEHEQRMQEMQEDAPPAPAEVPGQ